MKRTIVLLTIFAIAMGFMESAIVIYLRELYYPEGFKFPLTVIPENIARVEIFREAATIIMLVIIGIITGKNKFQRFCFFLFAFAVWDLFYYIFLKLFLDWPESLFTWDILFLIPVPWIGPVIAPCILCMTMIGMTMMMLKYEKKNLQLSVRRMEWTLLITGSLTIILSFVWDYIIIVSSASGPSITDKQLFSDIMNYIPLRFNWWLFLAGEIILLVGIFRIPLSKDLAQR